MEKNDNTALQKASQHALGQVYYRSKLFSIHDPLSPFVSAASPIFSLLDRFSVAKRLPPLLQVLTDMDHELKAFHSRLLSQMEVGNQHALAYYMLAMTVDEVLARSYLRLNQNVQFKAFTPLFYAEEEPGTQFFVLLQDLKKNPIENLALLELMYYCLMAGFEGKYQGKVDGRQALEAEIDALFRLIEPYRQADKPILLEVAHTAPLLVKKPYKKVLAFSLIMLGVVFSLYAMSYTFLKDKANKLRFMPTFITNLDE